ncbi:DUF4139 domain-containing protein [Urbifossiella limnaea]|uniref:DUF4139 domain-containing protein n=1 Tax=Urbifossiella limnaea TaxID=2528023 RepID=A0A517XMF9_9BACT|nr:DUF4139 domain-containing protein [Urbifossiella limnaea]QDU18693.1 hypothetical protein ETAA1_05860 [Urbifossiella limnaea]
MANLPIRRVVLYKHGVGHFEREAAVSGDETLTLAFKQREVSDVLKSLTVLDLGGGTVSAVSYDSTTPADQLLAEIALTIPDSNSLTKLLPQLRGARVAVRPAGATPVQGAVLGIDTAEVRTPAGLQQTPRLSILTDAGEVRSFDLFDLDLTLLDEGLRRDLEFLLKTQLGAKKKDARTFTLFAQGTGARTLRLSYVLEAPVWKATYRILLTEGDEPPLIQGWAVVDNTSDEDWTDVALSLVAGLPVSFVHDLYTPRYIRRPVVQVKETTGVLPPMAEAGFDDDFGDVPAEALAMSADFAPAPAAMRKMRVASASAAGMVRDAGRPAGPSSVETQTRERQVGDLFEYAIEKPVTVRRNQSALVPIVLKPFAGRSVLLYQKAARAENPVRCVEFENTTGLTLEGGPVTVLDGGSYVGEAMLDTLKPTEHRLVGYAVELGVRVLDNTDSHDGTVTRVTIKKGALKAQAARVQKTTYTFASKADREQVLYLDHPRDGGRWKLGGGLKPHETTENHWRFKLALPANSTTKFEVQQEQTVWQTFGLADVTDEQLGGWVSAAWLDKPTTAALRDVLAARAEAAGFEAKLAAVAQERAAIAADQKRLRENLGSLGDRATEKELRERFVRTLGRQEDRLEELKAEEARLTADRDAARARLAARLAALDYDGAVG